METRSLLGSRKRSPYQQVGSIFPRNFAYEILDRYSAILNSAVDAITISALDICTDHRGYGDKDCVHKRDGGLRDSGVLIARIVNA